MLTVVVILKLEFYFILSIYQIVVPIVRLDSKYGIVRENFGNYYCPYVQT
jgi:hypothetical protein